jgi:hypothetical protein
MDMSALASLTPEERAALKAALDAEPEKDPVEQLADAVKFLCEEVDSIKQAHDALKALVMEDLIGGIKEAYEGNVRTEEMTGFKGKYGAQLDPLAERFKGAYGKDLHEHAFDYMKGVQGEDGYTDEIGGSKIAEIVAQIKEKLGIKDEPAAVVAEAKPAEPAAEGEADEEPEADAQAAYNEIEQMKKRDEKHEARRKGA